MSEINGCEKTSRCYELQSKALKASPDVFTDLELVELLLCTILDSRNAENTC